MPLDSLTNASDDALLVLFANGDPKAALVLTHRLSPRVFAYGFRLLGDRNEAEDVAQEAMLRLWKVAPNWRPGEAKITTWLFRVVSNLSIDRKRRHHSRAVSLDAVADPPDGADSVEQTLQDKARSEALQTALLTLPDRQRQAVILRNIEGLANPEIASIMGISVEAVESLTARGKRALCKQLTDKRNALGFEDDR